MSTPLPLVTSLAGALRTARKAGGRSISTLAAQGGVSPRLVSEFERGMRPNISLDTALRLLQLVGVPLGIVGRETEASDEVARTERAERRRNTWVGHKTTLAAQSAPTTPESHVARLSAVARASRLAVGLQIAQTAKRSKPRRKR